ncbi:MAG TPA: hemin uptake protein HemP [Kiloniellales bacterium]|nr:hemin uptake protein HemP [Kiloniellales bacterium]
MTRGPERSDVSSAEAAEARPEQKPKPRQLASEALFQGAAELEILHDGAVYRLRRTGKGKLLLNK